MAGVLRFLSYCLGIAATAPTAPDAIALPGATINWAIPSTIPATDQDPGTEVISGILVPGGVECPLFRMDSGTDITQQGLPRSLMVIGSRLRIAGRWARKPFCQQGRTFVATSATLDK